MQERFGKHYSSEEDISHKEAFAKTNEFIKRHEQSNSTWTLAHNKFSDLVAIPLVNRLLWP